MTVWVWLLLAAALTAGKVRITKADLIVAKQMLKPNGVPASNGRWPMTRTVLMPMEKQSADNSYALPPQGYSIAPAGAPPMPMPMPMPMMPQYDSQPIMPPASPSSGYGSAPPPPLPSPPVTSYGTPVQTSGYGAAPAAGYGPAPPVYYEEEGIHNYTNAIMHVDKSSACKSIYKQTAINNGLFELMSFLYILCY